MNSGGGKKVRYVAGVAFAIAAFILVFFCTPQTGAIYTHDTQSYEYAALSLLESGTLKYFGYDTPIIQWPPFYILILAVFKAVGLTVAEGAAWLNAGLFAYLIYISSVYLFENLRVKLLSIPALILLTISVPFIHVSGYGWTEMLFIFLSVLSMVLMLMYIKRKKISWLISCAIVSSLCWLTRYIGITIIAALAIVLFISEKPFIERLKKTFAYGVFSCFPMALWVLRNFILSGTFTGGRQPGNYTFSDNIELSLSVFNEWFSFMIPDTMYISLIFLLLIILLAIPLKREKVGTFDATPDLLLNSLIVVFYSAVLLASATNTAMDPINSRLWSPVYPFLIFTVTFTMDILLRNIKPERTKAFFAAAFIVFSLTFSINPVMWIQSEGLPRKYKLLGSKESTAIKNSPVLALTVETVKPSENTLVISNEASILTMHTDLKCFYPPKKNGIPLYLFGRYSERIADYKNIYLVWSGPLDSESFMDVSEFNEVFNMERIAQNNYCSIYRLK